MTLGPRKIDLSFSLGKGAFGEDGADTVDITGLRTSVSINAPGGVQAAEMNLRVWGMPLDVMRKLTVLNMIAFEQQRQNTVRVMAGDDKNKAIAFEGTIREAWVDASNPPDVMFVVSALTGAMAKVRPIPPTSFQGPVDADTFFRSLASQVRDGVGSTGYGLENWGVQGVLDNPYYPGTALAQIEAGAAALNINATLDQIKRVLAIWPSSGTRGESLLDVSAQTGLIGYPQFTANGIAFTTLYAPLLVYGQKIKMTSLLGSDTNDIATAGANGIWVVAAASHDLDAEIAGGQWFTRVECGLADHVAPIIGTPS